MQRIVGVDFYRLLSVLIAHYTSILVKKVEVIKASDTVDGLYSYLHSIAREYYGSRGNK